jgi:glycosyltransferase involved in cell wall biosynthesis
MEMSHAFAEQGHEVTLVSKAAIGDVAEFDGSPHAFYGLPPLFDVLRFRRPARRGGGVIYEWEVARLLFRERQLWDLVYCRNLIGAWLATFMGMKVVFEAHELLEGRLAATLYRRLCRSNRLVRIVSITDALRRDLELNDIVPRFGDTVVAPSAVNPDKVRGPTEGISEMRRNRFGTATQVGYIGNLYAGRGVNMILGLAARLPGLTFHIVGGDEKALARLRKQQLTPNVVLHGFVRHELIGDYYDLFDVLLLPHQEHVLGASGTTDIARWCSPMKLFEYMATGKVIVASDLPVLSEVLRDGRNALIVPGSDIDAWEDAVRRLSSDEELRLQLGKAARRECLTKYTWTSRADTVLAGLMADRAERSETDSVHAHGTPGFQGGV